MHTNPAKQDPKSFVLRLPRDLHEQVTDAAAVNGVSQNAFLIGVIAGAMRWLSPDDEEAG
jgi:predicted HicB family RNase H-like nuclease